MDTYVKENYNLSRERVTVFTQVSSDPDLTLKPEFVFKGKGTRTSLHPSDGIKYNWAPKGSYRLEQMLYTISNLPNKYNIFTPKNYAIYVLDDYSVHIMPEIKEALLKRGYVPVIIGGGVTGDIQINDTDLHSPLKAKYRELEQLLMIDQLKANPKKIPQPSRDDMMRMLSESFEAVEIDVVTHFKSLWVKCIRWKRGLPGIRKNNDVSWRKIESISQTAKQSREPKEFKRYSEADYTT